jgi:hypothetical protein
MFSKNRGLFVSVWFHKNFRALQSRDFVTRTLVVHYMFKKSNIYEFVHKALTHYYTGHSENLILLFPLRISMHLCLTLFIVSSIFHDFMSLSMWTKSKGMHHYEFVCLDYRNDVTKCIWIFSYASNHILL